MEIRAELAAGQTPSSLFQPANEASAAVTPRTSSQSAGGAVLATYRVTQADKVYVRYDQFNGDPRTNGNIRALNFGYVRQVGKHSRVDFDYQFKNRESFNDDAANQKLQITWGVKF